MKPKVSKYAWANSKREPKTAVEVIKEGKEG
jgi:hypothetical protein